MPNLKSQIVLLGCKIYLGIDVTQFTKTLERGPVLLLRKVFEQRNAGKSLCIPHKLKYDGWTLQIIYLNIEKRFQSQALAEKRLVISKLVL